jgi:hypothetical protein
MRLRVAHEAARLMAEHGINDFYFAKTKAAASLGVVDKGALPNNREIEAALHEASRLFNGDQYDQRLARMRNCAIGIMQALPQFSPRAVGAVVSGAIGAASPLELHMFSEPAEMVAMALLEAAPDMLATQSKLRFDHDRVEVFAAYQFEVDEVIVDVTVFPLDGQRQAPLSPVTGRPMRRLNARALSALDTTAGGA